MRLKSLELHGFKSFPDKTVLNVDNGVTIVVGPNGSGKSNISDAVRWVLGELSSKNLRSTRMEDVIFGGAASRGPMSFCEVSLIIDNSDSENRLLSDYDEVTVTRRFYRSGESEYMLNRKPVRLKDIYELFMNTGVGKTGYSIIGQGKVAEIISQKSEERRQIFEEAAGISKYRHKKNEAEKKLAETNDNVLRVTDILNELKQRIGPLEHESKKAVRYVELYDQKKAADVGLWLYDTDKLKADLDKIEGDLKLASHELEMATDTVNAAESQNDRLYMTVQENNARSETLSSRIREITEKMYASEASFKVTENDIDHLRIEITAASSDKEARLGRLEAAKQNAASLGQTYIDQTAALNTLSEEEKAKLSDMEQIQAAMDAADEEINASEKAVSDASDSVTEAKIELSSLEGSSSTSSERRETLKADLSAIEDEIALLCDRIGRAEKTIADYTARRDGFRQTADDCKKKADELRTSYNDTAEEVSARRSEIAVKSQKADNLRRLEDLFEGYSHSVRYIMEAAEKNRLSGIHGPLSKIMTVDRDHALAIETALGANVQNIIVDDEKAARDAIALLKRDNAGRATFYPITSVKALPPVFSPAELRSHAGFIGLGSDLITCDARYRGIIGYLLGRTAVFDTLDHATKMEQSTGYKMRAVTLDGQIINAGGSYTGGSARHDSGIFTRAYEIEKLDGEVKKAKEAMAEKSARMAAIEKELEAITGEETIAADNAAMVESLLTAESTQYEVLKSRLDGDREQKKETDEALAALDSRDNDMLTRTKAMRERIESLKDALDAAEAAHGSLLRRQAERADSLTLAQDELNAIRLKQTEQRKDLQITIRDLEAEKENVRALEEECDALTQKIEQCRASIEQKETQIRENKQNVTGFTSEIRELEQEREQLLAVSAENEKTLNALREKLRDLSRQREDLFRENTRLESKRDGMLAEQDKRIERLWEDYELTYTTAKELAPEPVTPETRTAVAALVADLKNKIRALGHVNTGAIEEYKEVKERYEFLDAQLTDLTNSQTDLSGIIAKIEEEMRIRFTDTIFRINDNFKKVFRELFGGGTAEIVLTDPEHVLESGIDINVAPPGKIIKSLTLLSGGEQSFVAIALFFAILNVNPTPFCILDEIEAALDEVNVQRFAEYIKHYSDKTQFIVITHRRGTMNAADTLYGITMQERGISKIFTLDLEEAGSILKRDGSE